MVEFVTYFSHLKPKKVLVAGDFMLDAYTMGKVKRISPEAPVSVLQVEREEKRPGGAGNVVLNLVSLGAHVRVLGRIGHDAAGKQLLEAFVEEGVDTRGLIRQPGYRTPVKNRLIAENQQIVRVDYENTTPLTPDCERQWEALLPDLLQDVDVVALSDYAKGFLSQGLLQSLIAQARMKNIPVIVDPKGTDFGKYCGASIIKPNFSEALAAANLPAESPLHAIAKKIFHIVEVDALFITRSEKGIAVFTRQGTAHDYPVSVKEVRDVTGAGDTVLALLTLALANKVPLCHAARFCNAAASIAIEHFGCARVSLKDLARRLLMSDSVFKVFDMQHLSVLQEALSGCQYVVLRLSSAKGMTSQLFGQIRAHGRRENHELIVHVQEKEPPEDFIHLLTSLQEVSFVIIQNESLQSLWQSIKPVAIYSS